MTLYGEQSYLQWLKEATMARYTYACTNIECDYEVELTHSVHDDRTRMCPVCGHRIGRVITPPAVHFKGSGFASTDK